ncbi:phosphotransferase [Thermoflavimicrobium daqui]|uniref:Aminoglycoside phosphotransferase domain-containing protein n=1 Tax=Thermoflavimicrobium daqui TaxID=2137476 RepID=A0A364K8L2_9BACL|nr:phosphotransferase [Thermoflavimicrobium daqui]RAL26633.1 hypothetical protein DL897_00870 [Thermoflavimicrobium daqui]
MNSPRYKDIEKLLHQSVREISYYQRNWLIKTDRQAWIAKRIRSVSKHRWWLQLDTELRLRGFYPMLPIVSDQKRWMLTPFIKGKTCNYTNFDEVNQCVGLLAHFHYVGRNLYTPPIQGAAFLLIHRLHDRLVQFYRILHQADSIPGELGEILRAYGTDFYSYGLKAWERLEGISFARFNWDEYLRQYLTHRDLASHNWLVDQQGKIWMIDFDTAAYDCQLGDLWQITTRILSSNQWQIQVGKRIFSTYEATRPLSSIEKKYLSILFSFPNEFYREMIGLIQQKRGYKKTHSLPYIHKIILDRKNWLEFIKHFSSW